MSHTALEHAAPARATLHVGNLHYASEKAVVERVLGNRPGVISVDANPVAQTATVTFDPAVTSIVELARWIEECGYHCAGRSVPGHLCDPLVEEAGDAPVHDHAAQERADEAYGHGHGGHAGMSMEAMVRDMRNRFLVAVIFSVPIALWSPIGEAIFGSTPPTPGGISDELWQFLLSLPVVFYSSMVFFRGAWNALKAHTLDMMVLVAVAIGDGLALLGGGDLLHRRRCLLRGGRLPRLLRPPRSLVRDARPRRSQRRHARLARPGTADGGRPSGRRAGRSADGRGRGRRPAPHPSRLEGAGRRRGRRGRERGRRVDRDRRVDAGLEAPRRPARRRHDQQERDAPGAGDRRRLGYRARADRQARAGGAELEGARPAACRPGGLLARPRRPCRRARHLPRLVLRDRTRRARCAPVCDHGGRHHLSRRARAGDADGDHGRHRSRRQARHPLQERGRARAGGGARHGRLR